MKGPPNKTRGEYRPIYEALVDGKDYKNLTERAQHALLTIKLKSGAVGIRTWPAFVHGLAELCNFPPRAAQRAVDELIQKSWIEYSDGVVWIVRGLEFEPQMSPNNKNHQVAVLNAISGLPSAPIVRRFRAYYWEYCGAQNGEGHTEGDPDSHSNGIPNAIPDPSPTITPTPSPSPTPTPITTATTTVSMDHALTLVVAANNGLRLNYGEQVHPIHLGHSGAHKLVDALKLANVPADFAADAVFNAAKMCTLDRPPASMWYFCNQVIDAYQAERVRSASGSFTPSTKGKRGGRRSVADGVTDNLRAASILDARAGDIEYQKFCDDQGWQWREDAP